MTDICNLKYVQVPMIVLLDEELSSTTKLIMGLITTLTMQEFFCYANNRYLSNHMKVSKRTITNSITSLKRKKVYSSLNINRNLYTIYKDFLLKELKYL